MLPPKTFITASFTFNFLKTVLHNAPGLHDEMRYVTFFVAVKLDCNAVINTRIRLAGEAKSVLCITGQKRRVGDGWSFDKQFAVGVLFYCPIKIEMRAVEFAGEGGELFARRLPHRS